MMYEFREYHDLREGVTLLIDCVKPIGDAKWTATAYIDAREPGALPIVRMQFENVRNAEQFADMVRAVRNAAAYELERWAGVVSKNAGNAGGIL